jgi:hypothetical protein
LSSQLNSAQKAVNKRKLSASMMSENKKGKRSAQQVMWKPWKIVKRDLMTENNTLSEAKDIWRQRSMDPNYHFKMENGEWLMAEFVGVLEEGFHEHVAVGRMEAAFACEEADDVMAAESEVAKFLDGTDAGENACAAITASHVDPDGALPDGFVTGIVKGPFDNGFDGMFTAHLTVLESMKDVEKMKSSLEDYLLDCEAKASGVVVPEGERDEQALLLRYKQQVARLKASIVGQQETQELAIEHAVDQCRTTEFKGLKLEDIDQQYRELLDACTNASLALPPFCQMVNGKYTELLATVTEGVLNDKDMDDIFKQTVKDWERHQGAISVHMAM